MSLKIGVLGSSNGTDLDAIIDSIEKKYLDAEIKLIISNVKTALILEKAKNNNIKSLYISHKKKSREIFDPHYIIWLDTIEQGRVVSEKINELKNIKNLPFDANSLAESKAFDDTTKIFDPPVKINMHIKKFLNNDEIKKIAFDLKEFKK